MQPELHHQSSSSLPLQNQPVVGQLSGDFFEQAYDAFELHGWKPQFAYSL